MPWDDDEKQYQLDQDELQNTTSYLADLIHAAANPIASARAVITLLGGDTISLDDEVAELKKAREKRWALDESGTSDLHSASAEGVITEPLISGAETLNYLKPNSLKDSEDEEINELALQKRLTQRPTLVSIGHRPFVSIPDVFVRIEQTIYRHLADSSKAEEWRGQFAHAITQNNDLTAVFFDLLHYLASKVQRSLSGTCMSGDDLPYEVQKGVNCFIEASKDYRECRSRLGRATRNILGHQKEYASHSDLIFIEWQVQAFASLSWAAQSYIAGILDEDNGDGSSRSYVYDAVTLIEMALNIIGRLKIVSYATMAEITLALLNATHNPDSIRTLPYNPRGPVIGNF